MIYLKNQKTFSWIWITQGGTKKGQKVSLYSGFAKCSKTTSLCRMEHVHITKWKSLIALKKQTYRDQIIVLIIEYTVEWPLKTSEEQSSKTHSLHSRISKINQIHIIKNAVIQHVIEQCNSSLYTSDAQFWIRDLETVTGNMRECLSLFFTLEKCFPCFSGGMS